MAASVFPDWDVLPGLVAGYEGVGFHRGPSHSPIGIVAQALVLTPLGLALWSWLRKRLPGLALAEPPGWRPLLLVLLAGMGLHALADSLNPWGIAPGWPLSRQGATWNLVHEGDLGFLAVMAVCALFAYFTRLRTLLIVTASMLISLLYWTSTRRDEARRIAMREMGSGPISVYPTPDTDCPWSALTSDGMTMRAACVEPASGGFRWVRSVRSAESPLVEASKRDPAVADFLEDRLFPFAELDQTADGRPFVLWRDLRESLLERPGDPRFGLAVHFDEAGRIGFVEHRWLLKVAF